MKLDTQSMNQRKTKNCGKEQVQTGAPFFPITVQVLSTFKKLIAFI